MKKRFHLSLFWLSFACLLSLLASSFLYQTEQYKMVLESNQLRSPIFVDFLVDKNPNWQEMLLKEKKPFWILGKLETENAIVMGISSNHFSELNFPIKSGKFFSGENQDQAIIGEKVPTITEGKTRLFALGNKKYKVIGELGLASNGSLSNVALINDKDILNQAPQLSFNAYHLNKETLPLNSSQLGNSKGVERLLNIQRYQQVFSLSMGIVLLLSATVWTSLFCNKRQDYYHIYHLLGLAKVHIFRRELVLLGCLLLSSSLVTLPFFLYLPPYFRDLVLQYSLLLIVYTFLSFIFCFIAHERRS